MAGRHARGTLNVAFVDGSVRAMEETDFEKNLLLMVESAELPDFNPEDFENLQ